MVILITLKSLTTSCLLTPFSVVFFFSRIIFLIVKKVNSKIFVAAEL